MVAGEASGDLLAGRLLSGLRPLLPMARIHGIGGPRMIEHGFESHWPLEKLAVRGLFEVLMHYRQIKRIQTTLKQQLLQERPAVFIGVDAPDFNLSLERVLKRSGIPTMHFIGPSIWAWRGDRIKKIAAAVSHMLVVFPFEEQLYRNAGIPVTYVGHPLAEVIPMVPDMVGARAQLGLTGNSAVLGVLPGSRMSELKHNVVPFIEAAKLLLQRDPDLRILVPMAGPTQAQYFIRLVKEAGLEDVPLRVVENASHTVMAAADAVLVASGTASLEVALFKKPMVIAYRMMRASWEILRHMGYQPWVGLPNILAREFLVPELLQHAATPRALADAVWFQLLDTSNQNRLVQRFTDMHHALLRDTASIGAQAVLNLIEQSRRTAAV
ncbi:MAG: lipid-A-disaccharide synthase [Pseudomonadota bacterium]